MSSSYTSTHFLIDLSSGFVSNNFLSCSSVSVVLFSSVFSFFLEISLLGVLFFCGFSSSSVETSSSSSSSSSVDTSSSSSSVSSSDFSYPSLAES